MSNNKIFMNPNDNLILSSLCAWKTRILAMCNTLILSRRRSRSAGDQESSTPLMLRERSAKLLLYKHANGSGFSGACHISNGTSMGLV